MISVDRKQFTRALEFAQMAIERRNTIPALRAAKALANGALSIEGNDLDMTVRAEIAYEGESGVMLIPEPHRVRAAIGAAGGERVDFGLVETKLALNCGPLALLLTTIPADDHPGAEFVAEELWGCEVSAAELRQVARVFPAISTEETRYYLNGVCIDQLSDGWLYRFVATDGHRLMMSDVPLPGATGELPARMIVPRRFLHRAIAAFGKSTGPVRMSYGFAQRANGDKPGLPLERFGGPRFQLSGKIGEVPVTMATKLINGTFPDYTRVVPANNPILVRLKRSELAQALNAVSAMSSDKIRAVKLTTEPGKVRLSLKSPDLGEGSFTITAEHNAAKPFEIGFSGQYLLDIAAAFSGDELELHGADGAAPAVFRDPADTAFAAVQMPIRI